MFCCSKMKTKLKRIPTVNPSIDVDITKIKRRNDIDFRILVLTYNRPTSLKRLLDSLSTADYLNDSVCIEIWIDRSEKGEIHEETYRVGKTYHFEKGHIQVINQSRHVGIYGQWMATWQPSSQTNEMVVILEDDLTVSTFFYRYIKQAHRKYGSLANVNGISLNCNSVLGNHPVGKKLQAPRENVVLSYSIIGTWGFSPKKNNWIRFTNWYQSVYTNTSFQPFVPGILPTSWYKIFLKLNKTNTMWEMWHIYHSWIHNEVTIFPNLPNCEGFAISWRETGLHYTKKSIITDRLVVKWDQRLDHLPEKPIHLNVDGRVMEK